MITGRFIDPPPGEARKEAHEQSDTHGDEGGQHAHKEGCLSAMGQLAIHVAAPLVCAEKSKAGAHQLYAQVVDVETGCDG